MALNQLTNPATPPVSNPADWNNFVAREDKSNRGDGTAIDTISLTKWDATTDRPLIAQGSVIEVGGSLYLADSDTALVDDGGLADGAVHIKLVPSGGTVIPTLTSDVIPTWDATKGGWYDSDDKFLPFEMTRSGAITKVYSAKIRFPYQNKTYSFSSVGDENIDGALDVGGSGTFGGGGSFGGNVGITGDVTATGGISTGGNAVIKIKTLTAVSSGSGDTVIPHGIGSNYHAFTCIRTDNTSGVPPWVVVPDGFVEIDNTNITITITYASGVAFKVVVFYT